MSLIAGLNASIAGLATYGQRVAFESDNISRAGAAGAKEREAFVLDVNAATTVQGYTPGGVSAKVVQYITSVGGMQSSKVDTHMALTGQGFFIVKNLPTDQGTFGYSRVGTFSPDKDGNFKNTSGHYLQGWPTDTNGDVLATTDVITTAGLRTISTSGLSGVPVPTTAIEFRTSLPSNDTLNTAPIPSPPRVVNVNTVDAVGIEHTLVFTWVKTAETPGIDQTWTVTVTCADGSMVDPVYAVGMPVTFDNLGRPQTFNGGATPPDLTMTWNSSAAASVIGIDMGVIGTSSGITANSTVFNGTNLDANGTPAGNFQSVTIDSDTGIVSAKYDNGNVIPFAKIPLAMFANANELVEAMGGFLTPTAESGEYLITTLSQNGAGGLKTQNYENSTIDATEQFTKLVVDQTRYSGNLKSISTIKEMFQAVIQNI